MFVVIGATGNTGRVVARHLAAAGAPFRALTRDATRVVPGATDVQTADPRDADRLTRAFRGARAVYAMIPPYLTADDALAEGQRTADAIAAAIVRAGVGHVVALSSGGAHLTGGTGPIASLRALEAALAQTGAKITRLRAADFMENWAPGAFVAAADGMLPTGRMPPDGPMETVSVHDIGSTAAACLLAGPETAGTLNLLGPQDYTPADVASVLERLLNRKITLVPRNPSDLMADLIAAGIGDSYARGLLEIYDGPNTGRIGFEPGVGTTQRGSVSLEHALGAVLSGDAGPVG